MGTNDGATCVRLWLVATESLRHLYKRWSMSSGASRPCGCQGDDVGNCTRVKHISGTEAIVTTLTSQACLKM